MFVFLFMQYTAYEVRISDWSSDVCSSDLHIGCGDARNGRADAGGENPRGTAGPANRLHVGLCRGAVAPFDLGAGIRLSAEALLGPAAGRGGSRRTCKGAGKAGARGRLTALFALKSSPLFRMEPNGYARSEEHTSEIQSLMRNSSAFFFFLK